MAEMLLICNEAVERSAARRREKGLPPIVTPDHPVPDSKPMSLEYIADRLDVDDPIWGYQIRTAKEGWLQGFIIVTNFTSWHRWFRWSSLAMEAEVFDVPPDTKDSDRAWREARVRDVDGTIAEALDMQIRDGDINTEGIIFPHVAEISLLGALGCGSALVKAVVDELEVPSALHEFIVIHATDNAIPFYERNGFVHVGAVARHERKQKKSEEDDRNVASTGSGDTTPVKKKNGVSKLSNSASPRSPRKPARVEAQHGHVSVNVAVHKTARDDETPRDVANLLGVDVRDVLWLNRYLPGIHATAKLYAGTTLRVPALAVTKKHIKSLHMKNDDDDDDDDARTLEDALFGILDRLSFGDVRGFFAEPVSADDAPDYHRLIAQPMDISTIRAKVPNIVRSSPNSTAAIDEFERLVSLIVTNAKSYNRDMSPVFRSAMKMAKVSAFLIERLRELKAAASKTSRRLFQISPFVLADDNETPRQIAARIGEDVRTILDMNDRRINGLRRDSKLIEGTKLFIPPLPGQSSGWPTDEGGSENTKLNNDAITMAYRHWTTGDDPYEDSPRSYMMALCLKRRDARPRGDRDDDDSTAEEFVSRPIVKRTRRSMGSRVTSLRPFQYIPPHPGPSTTLRREIRLRVRVQDVTSTTLIANVRASWRGFILPSEKLTTQGNYKPGRKPERLFNSIVTLNDEGCPRAKKYEYWYVLTYIPDLQWCRIAPIMQDGVFGPNRRTYKGRPRYRLVPEGASEGCEEMDVSAWRCTKISARAMRHVPDADDEVWDIGPPPKRKQTENIYVDQKKSTKRRRGRPQKYPPPEEKEVETEDRTDITASASKADDDDEEEGEVEDLNPQDDEGSPYVEEDGDDDSDSDFVI